MPTIVTDDGTRVAFEQHGDASGTDVVLVAGFRTPGTSWRFQVPALVEAGHGVTVVDVRGHGAADAATAGTTMATRADDLEAVLRQLDITDAVLVGGSMGASTIWAYVAAHGDDRVRAVVSVDQTPRMLNDDPPVPGRPARGRGEQAPWEHGFYGYTARNRETLFARGVPPTGVGLPLWRRPRRVARVLRAMGAGGGSRDLSAADLRVLHDHATADWRPVIARFTKPVLFIAGAESEFWPSAHAAAAAALAPQGSSAVLLRAGHATNLEQWRAFNEGLLAFLEQL
ncbi:alpha/beta fold hydrolase [Agrococcus beijingensis]|uniref:alpha/beta fold hydrolase n=1 Tax=Agrococcus beijingensis TaxID=3068634 RepID=UPI002740B2B4|nr:alpha/beta hydrolase [Agrococcus sp. REN33]